ncbi:hypothetical protein ACHAXS_000181 [Conticribra weissflogii]
MVELQMECSALPKENLLPNMHTESLLLVFSITVVWFECSCILLDTHALTLLMLSIVLQDICSAQSLCMDKPSSKLVAFSKLLLIKGLNIMPSEKLLNIDSFPDAHFLGCMGTKQWMILSVSESELDM